jgi:hypothetical protein
VDLADEVAEFKSQIKSLVSQAQLMRQGLQNSK